MREFIAKTGGRYTYIEDFIGLQEISLSLTSIFEGCNNFILSGCKTSGTNNSNIAISEGYVFIKGKIRHFEGGSIDLTKPYYIVEKERTESVKYAGDATQQGCIIYECFGSDVEPIDKQFIKITSTYIPRLKDEFFGKYAVTLNSAFNQQTVSQNIAFDKNISVKGNITSVGNITQINSDKQAEIKQSILPSGDGQYSFFKNGTELSKLLFGYDGCIKFISGGIEKLVISPTNTACDLIGVNELRTSELAIKGNEIDNFSTKGEDGGININRTGYNGTANTPRHFNVYGGKKQLLFRVDGSKNTVISYGAFTEESTNEFGITLRDTAHSYREPNYKKSIAWKDNAGVILGSIGYSDTSKNDLVIKNEQGDVSIVARQFNISGTILESGQSLDSTYAKKAYVDDELAKKVNSVAGMGLSEQNFTSADKAKLDSIKQGSIGSGNDGMVNGNDVSQALAGKLDAANNLSDVNDKAEARENLNIFSKSECESYYLRKDKKLSDLPTLTEHEKENIRNAIGAAKIGDSPADSGVRQIVKEEMKSLDEKFALKSTTGIKIATQDGLTFVQIGGVVSIGGKIEPAGGAGHWFNIPNSIGAPATVISGVIFAGFGKKEDINYGLTWECQAESRNITCPFHYYPDHQEREVTFSCTYVTKTKPGNAEAYL